jgi:hypothetical protein
VRERAREKRQREVKVSRERARMRARASERQRAREDSTHQASWASQGFSLYFFYEKREKNIPSKPAGQARDFRHFWHLRHARRTARRWPLRSSLFFWRGEGGWQSKVAYMQLNFGHSVLIYFTSAGAAGAPPNHDGSSTLGICV